MKWYEVKKERITCAYEKPQKNLIHGCIEHGGKYRQDIFILTIGL